MADQMSTQQVPNYSQQYTPSSASSGGGGSMDFSGYAAAGASTFETAVNWIMFGQQMQQNALAREESMELANILRGDTLRQQAVQNKQAQQGLNISARGQKLSEEQFQFNKDITQKTLDTQKFEAMINRLNANMQNSQQFQQYTRSLLGGR